jgi:hypothetical protein
VKGARSGFLARQERRSQLNGICAQSQSGDHASRVPYSARSDHRHIDDIDDLRDKRERAREGILRGPEE